MKINLDGMTVAELDELIANAAEKRARTQNYPEEPPNGPFAVTLSPGWKCAMVDNGAMLQIRHADFGWLAFLIPPEDRKILLHTLQKQEAAYLRVANIETDAVPSDSGAGGIGSGKKGLH